MLVAVDRAPVALTLAESHIAVSLAQGRTVRDIALATGRSAGTVRWHIKHIFAKCGISRQMELVQLVLSLADLPQTRPASFLPYPPNVGGERESPSSLGYRRRVLHWGDWIL